MLCNCILQCILRIFSYSHFSLCVIYRKFRRKEENCTTLYISERCKMMEGKPLSKSLLCQSVEIPNRAKRPWKKSLSYSPVTWVTNTYQHVLSLLDSFSFACQMLLFCFEVGFVCLFVCFKTRSSSSRSLFF